MDMEHATQKARAFYAYGDGDATARHPAERRRLLFASSKRRRADRGFEGRQTGERAAGQAEDEGGPSG